MIRQRILTYKTLRNIFLFKAKLFHTFYSISPHKNFYSIFDYVIKFKNKFNIRTNFFSVGNHWVIFVVIQVRNQKLLFIDWIAKISVRSNTVWMNELREERSKRLLWLICSYCILSIIHSLFSIRSIKFFNRIIIFFQKVIQINFSVFISKNVVYGKKLIQNLVNFLLNYERVVFWLMQY